MVIADVASDAPVANSNFKRNLSPSDSDRLRFPLKLRCGHLRRRARAAGGGGSGSRERRGKETAAGERMADGG